MLKNCKLQSFTSRSIFAVEPNFLHQNVCFTVAKVIISVSQVNIYCFELRKMRTSVAPSRKIWNYIMVTT